VIAGLLSVLAAVGSLLIVLEALFPSCRKFLPLGGSHIAQIGILFGSLMAVLEVVRALTAFATQ